MRKFLDGREVIETMRTGCALLTIQFCPKGFTRSRNRGGTVPYSLPPISERSEPHYKGGHVVFVVSCPFFFILTFLLSLTHRRSHHIIPHARHALPTPRIPATPTEQSRPQRHDDDTVQPPRPLPLLPPPPPRLPRTAAPGSGHKGEGGSSTSTVRGAADRKVRVIVRDV